MLKKLSLTGDFAVTTALLVGVYKAIGGVYILDRTGAAVTEQTRQGGNCAPVDLLPSAHKQFYDGVAEAGKLVERFNNRLARSISNLAERYAGGEVELNLTIRVDADDLLLRAKRIPRRKDEQPARTAMPADLHAVRLRGYRDQLPVFALVVEPVQGVQSIVPSTIRLERFDDVPVRLRQALDLSPRTLVQETVVRVADREVHISRFYGPVVFRESDGEMVKAVAQCLDNHSRARIDRARDRLCQNDLEEPPLLEEISLGGVGIAGNVRLRLLADAVGVAFDEETDIRVKSVNLRLCPIEFGLDAG